MVAPAATVPAQAVHPDTTDCPNVFIANDHISREVPKQWGWIQTFRGVLQSQLVSQLFSRLSLLCKSSEGEQYEWRFYVIWSYGDKASIPMGNFAGLSLCTTTAAATHSQPACFL